MSHNNNTSDHQLNGRLQDAARAEISGGVSRNNLYQWSSSSSLSRALFRCPHCAVVIVQYPDLHSISYQSLPLWCSNCRIFNPQWEYLVTDYRWNANQVWENWTNVQYSIENQNAVTGFARTNNIDNNGGQDQSGEFANYGWNMDAERLWEYLINVQFSEYQNSSAAQRTEEVVDNYPQEIIWKYLITRDCRKYGNNEKDEEEICVICQNEFEEDAVFKCLDCGHDFHYECISQWLLHKNSCPLCIRTVISSDFECEFDFVFNYD